VHPGRMRLVVLNVVGGIAVLASYAWGLGLHPELADALWGGVPEGLRPVYQVNMVLAALGYFPFTAELVLRSRPGDFPGPGHAGLQGLYAGVLLPSALWMPLTLQMLREPSTLLWWAVRIDLLVVGLSALGLLALIARMQPRPPALRWGLALAGCGFFCLQTAVLDALVWPAYFGV